ncbi:MAG: type II toxin-antitoxin system VapC family toxin [Rhodospirillales bacterium]|nr:type II toxin-antitoxin system VapC family toxin [Rhodospirillales bacterium]
MTPVPPAAVVDASVAVKWVIGEAGGERAAALKGARLYAPDLWVAECANVLWKKAARNEITADEAELAAMAIEAAEVELIATRPLLARAVRLARQLGHAAYDCLYLLAAADRGIPLVTADARLAALARTKDVPASVIALSDLPPGREGA